MHESEQLHIRQTERVRSIWARGGAKRTPVRGLVDCTDGGKQSALNESVDVRRRIDDRYC